MQRRLILLRHGESLWNAKNLFTGWVDVELSEKGKTTKKVTGTNPKCPKGYKLK